MAIERLEVGEADHPAVQNIEGEGRAANRSGTAQRMEQSIQESLRIRIDGSGESGARIVFTEPGTAVESQPST